MTRMKFRRIFVLAFLLGSLGCTFGIAAFADDARVRIVSPKEGQQFAPGDKVSIVVSIASLHVTDGSVGIAGLGSVKGKGFPGKRFTADFVIPDYYAGPLTLQPDVWAGETVLGAQITINVRPPTPPKQLTVLIRYNYLSPLKTHPEQLYVKGRYNHGLGRDVDRDLTSSASGTTYKSSNASVISVDPEGACTVLSKGWAVITIQNKGVRDFAVFVVDDPAQPSPPTDLSGQVAIRRGELRQESNPRVWRSDYQRVTVTNTSPLPIPGPLFLAVTGLPKGVLTRGGNGDGIHRLDLPDQGLGLLPGQSVTVDLDFLNQGLAPIDYTAKVYHGEST